MSNLYRGPSIDGSYQVSVHLATKQFQRRRFFRNRPIKNKNSLWQTCLLTDRKKMSNLYRGSAIDASYQVLVSEKMFRNQQNKKQELPVAAMLLITDRDKMCNLYRGPSLDASCQISAHLAKGFQRRRLKCEKLTDDKMTDNKWWQKLTLPLAHLTFH